MLIARLARPRAHARRRGGARSASQKAREDRPGGTTVWRWAVDFEINQPDGFRYRPPYVAVWLEDKDGKPVRTLSLWVEPDARLAMDAGTAPVVPGRAEGLCIGAGRT